MLPFAPVAVCSAADLSSPRDGKLSYARMGLDVTTRLAAFISPCGRSPDQSKNYFFLLFSSGKLC